MIWWPGAESQNRPQPAPPLTFTNSSYLQGYAFGYTKLSQGGGEILESRPPPKQFIPRAKPRATLRAGT